MIRGLYTAASGMIVQQKRQENTSNNIANIDTPSYKKQALLVSAREASKVFKEDGDSVEALGGLELGPRIDGTRTDYGQGLFRETGRALDVAIDGDGFFRTALASGREAYTRGGSLRRDPAGYLVNAEGNRLWGESEETGRLEAIRLETETFSVASDGTLSDGDGKKLYTLALAAFDRPDLLEEAAPGVYVPTDGTAAAVRSPESIRLATGTLEASNVNALEEMVKLIEISRSFESNQRVVQFMDDTLDKAVNEIGRV